ncbi:syndecan-2-B-like [Xiphophorus hellerii]|uniref:syndecan-2-B-like n=1 Tax=Xiphophorus hellerii TaxID=8084 RepID=UPI0013B39FD8|nr:syndecan-2-B-like [Xiphophorus hellerii]
MNNLWLFFLVALSTGFIGDKLLVLSHSTTSQADDLYIEEPGSGDVPIDDEDGEDDGSGSGSGSGDHGFSILSDQDEVFRFLNITESILYKEVLPLPAQPTVSSISDPQTKSADKQDPEPDDTDETPDSTSNFVDEDLSTSASPVDATTDFSPPVNEEILVDTKVLIKVESDNFPEGGRNNRRNELNSPQEVTSENLWERTEVLAAVIACGVVGFLCAISLLLLLAYRMKKKDEGSYDLGDTKMSATAYHKAPTKEFYA